ncbi:MAG: hypothetical protein B9S32_14885 [Verrucomicrobia bacterium Tous-C9LFEB]|nr:MAG: hypothetical protein B9S32_14885 [Verrucomicrobia bacterium Tous-C9LFEB]
MSAGCSFEMKADKLLTPMVRSLCLLFKSLWVITYLTTVLSAAEIPPVHVFGTEKLASPQGWNIHNGCRLTPAASGRLASLEFPTGKWTALIGTLPLDKKMKGSFLLRLKCRWMGDTANLKATSVGLLYLDADTKTIKDAGASKVIAAKPDWQDLKIEATIPTEAVAVRFDIASHGGGTLEIESYELEWTGVDLSETAIKGVALPWLTIPGGKEKLAVEPGAALVEFSTDEAFSFDSPVWEKRPAYKLAATSTNKTPLNDVAASFQLSWSVNALVVRFRAQDRFLNFKHESRYERDCFEFFLMPSGRVSSGSGLIGKEQYTVSRSMNGETSANATAITRLVKDGWEAILKIPLRNEARRITPFNGLTLTFNAGYHDANTIGQEHWLSFSPKDQANASWRDPGLYVPLIFQTDETVAYRPLWLGDVAEYNVEPQFPGRFNLVLNSTAKENFSTWMRPGDGKFEVMNEEASQGFRIQFAEDAKQAAAYALSPFNVLPGEVIIMELEVRGSPGASVSLPRGQFVSQSSWQIVESKMTSPSAAGLQWIPCTYTMPIPDRFRDNIRNGRILLQYKAQPGRTIETRNIRVTRRTPADFDALISVSGLFSHFWSGEKNSLRFKFASGAAIKTKIKAEVKDYFGGATVLSQEWAKDVAVGESDLSWDVSSLPNGFFNVLLKVRNADGKFLADRELYISKGTKADRISAFSGLFFDSNLSLPAPLKSAEAIALFRNLGVGMVNWLNLHLVDGKGRDLPGDPLETVRAFKQAGFITGAIVERGSYSINREWQPGDMPTLYEKTFLKTKGLIDFWNFANEPNLPMGWGPAPDGREWAVFYRGFYNALKRHAPEAKPILGCFNQIPESYIRAAAEQNQNSFADGVVGVHLYGLEANGEGFKQLMQGRTQIDQVHPGWDVWDTESGLVFHNYRSILDLQSKKMPILLCAGFSRSFFYLDTDMVFPCGDSTPLLPMESFKNSFYMDCSPVGRATLAEGKVHLYLFQRKDGMGMAAFWNTGSDEVSIELPLRAGAELFDVFGNRISLPTDGKNRLVLKDRLVHYARGVDLALLQRDPSFIASFKSNQSTPATDRGYTTTTYLALPDVTKAFDREVAVGQPTVLSVSLHNESKNAQVVKLTGSGPDGLKISFKDAVVSLKSSESRLIQVELLADRNINPQSFRLMGTLEDGSKLLPLVFTVKTAPAISVAGYTRSIELRNNSTNVSEIEVVATKNGYLFKPDVLKQRLQPSTSANLPIAISSQGKGNDFNRPIHYDLHVKWPGDEYTKDAMAILFRPQKLEGTSPDLAHLSYSALPEIQSAEKFQADYDLFWVPEGLRILARVQDATPVQDRENGDLKNGGDCLVLAFDRTVTGEKPGAGYLECGFAFGRQSALSYSWDGNYGLETAKPFTAAIRRIHRDANYIYYDVVIPEKLLFPVGASEAVGMSMVFINRGLDGKSQRIELGQGILPERDPTKMGLLLKRK